MTEMFEVVEGMTVFLQPTGNNERGWDGEPIRGTVSKIARKYFYVKLDERTWGEERFDRKTFIHDDGDTNGGYIIYPSRKSFERAKEGKEMLYAIRIYFGGWANSPPSYEALKQIYKILHEEGLI